ncbi:uncharacterized protein [Glycine max]|uniref:uncharacterized protein n=1 Tax=Glycine max TaxID=3847 RepID=UPI001B3551A3|nr:uncharacterized protein LOC106798510 [Glycine max]
MAKTVSPMIKSGRFDQSDDSDLIYLLRLRELASLVSDPVDFQAHHGKLLRILRVDVEEGCLETLVQFYDPLYHCFTFPDYQLVPTLEEYSYLVGLPVPDKIPFHGFEPTPKPSDIAAALHLKTSIIQANLTSKGGLQGLPPTSSTNKPPYLLKQLWFTFHLPQSRAFKTNDDKLSWPRRIMTLDPSDIVWYQAASDVGEIIVSCGEYPNVPLLGMRGGISYNPLLARRQFGYPIKTKPNNLALTNEFYLNHGDHSNKRERFAQAWSAIRRLNRSQLGKKLDYVHESYTQWVIDRTKSFGLPYRLPRYLSSTIPPSSLPIPFDTKEEFHEQLTKERQEKETWKRRYQELEQENEILKGKIAQQSRELFIQNQRMIEKDDLLRRKDALLHRDARRKRRYVKATQVGTSQGVACSGQVLFYHFIGRKAEQVLFRPTTGDYCGRTCQSMGSGTV